MGTLVASPTPLTTRRAHASLAEHGEALVLTECTHRQSSSQHWRLSSVARSSAAFKEEPVAQQPAAAADAEAAVSAALALAPKRATPAKDVPASAPAKTAPKKGAAAADAPPPTGAGTPPKALSQTDKFRPWFRQLEAQLLAVGLDVVRETTGARVDSGAEDMTEEESEALVEEERRKQRTLGPAAYEARQLEGLQQLGHRMGKLTQLLGNDVLPKFPQDPEALFLCAAADFLSRKFETALRAMQQSLAATAEGHCTPRELAARQYFVALIATRIATEAQDPQLKGDEAKPLKPTLPERRRVELEGIIERGLGECLRLDPRLHSAYIDTEMLGALRFPDDAERKVALCADMVRAACATGRYWVHPLQRPMHFYPKLRSQPWWEASDFDWAAKLLEHYDDIRREVLRMRQTASSGTKAERWDQVRPHRAQLPSSSDTRTLTRTRSAPSPPAPNTPPPPPSRALRAGGHQARRGRPRAGRERAVDGAGAAQSGREGGLDGGAQPQAVPDHAPPARQHPLRRRHGAPRHRRVHLLGARRRRAPQAALRLDQLPADSAPATARARGRLRHPRG